MKTGHALLCRHGAHHYIRQMWYDGPPERYAHTGRLVWRCSLCGHRIEKTEFARNRAEWHRRLCSVGPPPSTYAQLTVRIDGRGFSVIFDDGDGNPSHLQLPNTETNCRVMTGEALSGLKEIYDLARSMK